MLHPLDPLKLDHVRRCRERSRDLRAVTSGNDHVVILARSQPAKHWSSFLRFNQRQIVEESKDIGRGFQPRLRIR